MGGWRKGGGGWERWSEGRISKKKEASKQTVARW